MLRWGFLVVISADSCCLDKLNVCFVNKFGGNMVQNSSQHRAEEYEEHRKMWISTLHVLRHNNSMASSCYTLKTVFTFKSYKTFLFKLFQRNFWKYTDWRRHFHFLGVTWGAQSKDHELLMIKKIEIVHIFIVKQERRKCSQKICLKT